MDSVKNVETKIFYKINDSEGKNISIGKYQYVISWENGKSSVLDLDPIALKKVYRNETPLDDLVGSVKDASSDFERGMSGLVLLAAIKAFEEVLAKGKDSAE